MHNKLIIATFLTFLSLAGFSQIDESNIVNAETNIHHEPILSNTNKVNIYPNPAVDHIYVEIGNSTLENTVFEMRSIIGTEIIITPKEENGVYRIQVDNFATGYYFLVVKDEMTRFKKAYRFLKK